jgi:FkbM family methyltransferase
MFNFHALLRLYRRLRILTKKLIGYEPNIPIQLVIPMEYHGNQYCGWRVPNGVLSSHSVIVDVGLGEDISFSTSLIDRYQCNVHGFDPTPRSIDYVESLSYPKFTLHKVGVAANSGRAAFYLPNNELHVSGSLTHPNHTGLHQIEVELITIDDVFKSIGCNRINLLKIDIEGAEYDLLMGECFERHASNIDTLCIEFHHRWPNHGIKATEQVVNQLKKLGFLCTWFNPTTNEEFTFQRP